MDDKQYNLVVESFSEARALMPQIAKVYEMRGWTFSHKEEYKKALADLTASVALDAMDPDALWRQGRILRYLKRVGAAKEAYDKAAFYGAYDHKLRGHRGSLLLYELADPEAAIDDLRAATELKPDHAHYWLNYGRALFEAHRCEAEAALATYLRLCRGGSDCDEVQVNNAAGAIEHMVASGC